jgi:hypothetical protein
MTWLDVMPAIPLARSVPVARGRARGVVELVLRGQLRAGGEGCQIAWDDEDGAHRSTTGADLADSYSLRVDLDDPQGFAYAMGEAVRRGVDVQPEEISENIVRRHFWKQTTDADRLALATALRAVVPS